MGEKQNSIVSVLCILRPFLFLTWFLNEKWYFYTKYDNYTVLSYGLVFLVIFNNFFCYNTNEHMPYLILHSVKIFSLRITILFLIIYFILFLLNFFLNFYVWKWLVRLTNGNTIIITWCTKDMDSTFEVSPSPHTPLHQSLFFSNPKEMRTCFSSSYIFMFFF